MSLILTPPDNWIGIPLDESETYMWSKFEVCTIKATMLFKF